MKRLRFGILMIPLVVMGLAIGSPAMATTNLFVNPGFESSGGSYDGWFTFGNVVTISTPGTDNIARTGIAAAKVFGDNGCPGSFSTRGFGQSFTPTAGMTYQLSGYSFVSSADQMPGSGLCTENRMVAKIVYRNAGNAVIQVNETVIGSGETPTDTWNQFFVESPVPVGATVVEALFLFFQPGCDTGSVFVDDVTFCEAPTPVQANVLANPSFDSGLTGWSTFGNAYAAGFQTYEYRTLSGSAKMFSTFTMDSPSGIYQTFAATPGTWWRMRGYAMTTCESLDEINDTNDNYVVARLVFRDAGDVEIGSDEVLLLDASYPDLAHWKQGQVIEEAPVGTATVSAYVLFISPTLMGGSAFIDDISLEEIPDPTGVKPPAGEQAFELYQNVPNPFNPTTRIDFELHVADDVVLVVYDAAGRRVATLLDRHLGAGPHHATWDGTTDNGVSAASGVYWYSLKTSSGQMARRMVLLK